MPLQELFEKIDLEEDGLVYLKEIVVNVLLSRTSIFPDFLLDVDFKMIKKLIFKSLSGLSSRHEWRDGQRLWKEFEG